MLQGADHYATHMSEDDDVVDAALRTRRPLRDATQRSTR